jgi:hypothetical protein
MKNIYSFHREENKRTRQLSALIDNLRTDPTDIEHQKVNIFTLVWALTKDETYNSLVRCKTTNELKRLLQSDRITILSGKGHQVYLNLANYTAFKSELNLFYKYLVLLADYFVQNRMFINKEKILKDLKNKDASFPFLLRQDHLVFKLQRLIGLPRLMIKGAYEVDRLQISFEEKKALDEFILFLMTDVSDRTEVIKTIQQGVTEFTSFVKRRKEVVVGLLVVSLMTVLISLPSLSPYQNTLPGNLLQVQEEQYARQLLSVHSVAFDALHRRLLFSLDNATDQDVTVQRIILIDNHEIVDLYAGNDIIDAHGSRTYDLQDTVLHTGALVRILGTDHHNRNYRVEIPL